MNAHFSESSRLLIENWDIVKEIHESEAALTAELRDYLFSIQQQLVGLPWWDDQWAFERHNDSQVYIARRDWVIGDEYAFWIGLEGFTPEALFGTESCASLYIWVTGAAAGLVSSLRDLVARHEEIVGELSAKQNRYVVKSALRKCLPEEIDRFDEVYGEPILKFFDHYGRLHPDFTAAFRELRSV